MESEDRSTYFYTPITPDDFELTVSKSRVCWVACEMRIKSMMKNITKMAGEDEWPPMTVVFLTYLTNYRSKISNDFLLPFENKMLAFRRQQKVEDYNQD